MQVWGFLLSLWEEEVTFVTPFLNVAGLSIYMTHQLAFGTFMQRQSLPHYGKRLSRHQDPASACVWCVCGGPCGVYDIGGKWRLSQPSWMRQGSWYPSRTGAGLILLEADKELPNVWSPQKPGQIQYRGTQWSHGKFHTDGSTMRDSWCSGGHQTPFPESWDYWTPLFQKQQHFFCCWGYSRHSGIGSLSAHTPSRERCSSLSWLNVLNAGRRLRAKILSNICVLGILSGFRGDAWPQFWSPMMEKMQLEWI